MTDILLGHTLFMARDPKQMEMMRPYPPLGTLYAAGVLRDSGYNVALFDAMIEDGPSAFETALDHHSPSLVALFEDSFNFYSKMCLGTMRDAALQMVRAAAQRGIPVVIAGSDATDDPAAFLKAGADAIMLGEAEHTLVEVVAALGKEQGGRDEGGERITVGNPSVALEDRADEQLLGGSTESNDQRAEASSHIPTLDDVIRGISGLALLDADSPDGIYRTPARPPEREPDVFGLPARDLVDMQAYEAKWQSKHGHWSLNMVSTRGCPFHCNWCAKPIWGQRYAMRDPVAVAEELAHVGERYGPDSVWFADDIFGLRPDWTVEFGRAVEAIGGRTPFTIQTRVDLIDDAAADALAQAGCAQAWLGVESGSQRILDAMEKGIKAEAVPVAVERLQSRGIQVGMFIQFGYPGETWEDITKTVDLVRETLPDEIGVSVSYPLPGTSFYERVAAELGETKHWNDSLDLAMLFQGSYTTGFYRRLHSLLHRDLDARRAVAGLDGELHSLDSRPLIAQLELEWAALAAGESAERNEDATAVPQGVQKPAPDLSRASN